MSHSVSLEKDKNFLKNNKDKLIENFKMKDNILTNNLYFFSKTSNVIMTRGKGIYLYDIDGKDYIDCASATFNLSLGYSHPEVLEAVRNQMDELIHVTSSFMTIPISKLVKKLVNVTGENLNRVHLKVSSGSVANEGAIKMAQYYSGKKEVISLFRSHVGQTIFTAGMSGNSFRRKDFNLPMPYILHVPAPYCYRCFYNQKPGECNMLCAEKIVDFITFSSYGNIAAIIIEPILGNGDNIVCPDGYLDCVRKICDEYDISLILDEIQTGIGRTGHMFAYQHFNVEPDILTVGKGLGGSGFQIAAIISKEKYSKMPGMHHSFTYGSNVLAATAALKTLEIIDKKEFLENVTKVGDYITEKLFQFQEKYYQIGDIRGIGLMIGIEIITQDGQPDTKLTNKLANIAMQNGIIIRTSRYSYGNVFKIRPPLIITQNEADLLLERLEKTFKECFK